MRRLVIVAQALVLALALLLLLPGSQTAYAQAAPRPVPTTKGEIDAGAPPAVGWKWRIADRTFLAGSVEGPHKHVLVIQYTVEGTHEVKWAGGAVERFAPGQAVFIPAQVEHSHTPFPSGIPARVIGIQLNPGDTPLPSEAARRDIRFFSETPIAVKTGLPYRIQVREIVFPAGARSEGNVPTDSRVNYVMEGTLTERTGGQVIKREAGAVWEWPPGVSQVYSNEGTTPVRVLRVELLPAPATPATGDSSSGWLMGALAGAGAALVAAGLWLRRRAAARR